MGSIQDHRIRFFFEAVQRGSVRAAADFLNVAPSAVSRHISQLEAELASPLIERHRRGIRQTEAGEQVIAYYRVHMAQQELLMESIQALHGLQSGSISLAIGEGYIEDVSPVLSHFAEKYPSVELAVSICGSNDVLRQITEDEAHIGVVFNPARDPKIRSHISVPHPLCAVVNHQHPLRSSGGEIEVNQLKDYRLALTEVSHGIRQIVAQAEDDLGIILTPSLICNNLSLLKSYACNGGVTLLPAFMASDFKDGLCFLPLHNDAFSSTRTHVVTRLGRQLSMGAGKLLKMLQSEMKIFNTVNS
ncbi:LysR family transcriptional regulator [Citrobacter sp. JGM124]|uniref:LysR family transcriptional regulator n=1 Tax=Citrobacter sp. JGM124 TaxID=2799789 RepID=UPI001BAA57FA|nr:LysR family transcriptional regulator [Citrobacter sp. JGM124]MBS0849274.1 LysR family transcriptional regulator [Citrobacter sp. JGM124]